MECILCNKQYVGKAKTSFYMYKTEKSSKRCEKIDAIIAWRHFHQEYHNFNKYAKFTIIDQLTSTSKSKETLKQQLIERQKFGILT